MNPTMQTIKEYILAEFLPGESPEDLTEDTQLFTAGLLDSLASLKLVSFLEEQFGIRVEAHEVMADNLDTLTLITAFVERKRG